jgi:hypothetical protein
MEFPDLVLALIREYARPRVSKEARDEYKKVIKIYGKWPRLKQAMVSPQAVQVVRAYNSETDLIDELELAFRETPLNTPRSAQIRTMLRERYDCRRILGREIRVLLAGESGVRELEKVGGFTY